MNIYIRARVCKILINWVTGGTSQIEYFKNSITII